MSYIENGDVDGAAQLEPSCLLQNRTEGLYIDLMNKATWTIAHTVGQEPAEDNAPAMADANSQPRPGFYYVFFSHCTDGLQVSFNVRHSTEDLLYS
jgi:hypothetical protein